MKIRDIIELENDVFIFCTEEMEIRIKTTVLVITTALARYNTLDESNSESNL